jgi:hypothetical protein
MRRPILVKPIGTHFVETSFSTSSAASAAQNSVQLLQQHKIQFSCKSPLKKKTCTERESTERERERGRARRERSRNGFEKTKWVGLRETMGERNRKKKLKEKN